MNDNTPAYRAGYLNISHPNPHAAGSEPWAAWQTGRRMRTSSKHETYADATAETYTKDGRVYVQVSYAGTVKGTHGFTA